MLFVGKPLHALCVAVMLLLGDRLLRSASTSSGSRARGLMVAGLCWLAYSAWEWLVRSVSPEANIRVDLLLIWPLLGAATLWGLSGAIRSVLARGS